MAKAFRTTSSEALCILTGTTPIIIRTEEAVKQYIRKNRGSHTQLMLLQSLRLKTTRTKEYRYTKMGARKVLDPAQ